MKLTFGTHEEIDRIETGNTVLISGLHNKEFKFINNKCGIVKNIYIQQSDSQIFYVAEVELIDSKKKYTINFDYLYKMQLKRVVDNIIQHIITLDNPVIYYWRKKSLQTSMAVQDEFGQYLSICVDKKGKSHVLLFSGVN